MDRSDPTTREAAAGAPPTTTTSAGGPLQRLVPLVEYLPQRLLSLGMYRLARCRHPLVRVPLVRFFVRRYRPEMDEALEPEPDRYESFDALFTRRLRPGARPIDPSPATLVSPADGVLAERGAVEDDTLWQAKGRRYSLTALLGGDAALAARFAGGGYATVYLSPRNYHRVHAPAAGELRLSRHVPGRLLPVGTLAVNTIDAVFARNERLMALFDAEPGAVAVVMVGALLVGSIETVWNATASRHPKARIEQPFAPGSGPRLGRGEELGAFHMGSTVIVLCARPIRWASAPVSGQAVRVGQALGSWRA